MSDLSARTAYVLSISNRAAAGVYEDTTGPRIVKALTELGFGEVDSEVVPDGEPVRVALDARGQRGASTSSCRPAAPG